MQAINVTSELNLLQNYATTKDTSWRNNKNGKTQNKTSSLTSGWDRYS